MIDDLESTQKQAITGSDSLKNQPTGLIIFKNRTAKKLVSSAECFHSAEYRLPELPFNYETMLRVIPVTCDCDLCKDTDYQISLMEDNNVRLKIWKETDGTTIQQDRGETNSEMSEIRAEEITKERDGKMKELTGKQIEQEHIEKRSMCDLILTKFREAMRARDFDTARAAQDELENWYVELEQKIQKFKIAQLEIRDATTKLKKIQLEECPEGLPVNEQQLKRKKDYSKLMSKEERLRSQLANTLGMSVSDYVEDMKKAMEKATQKAKGE